MPNYTVHWSIDLTARTPREAAQLALMIQRDMDSTALVYDIDTRCSAPAKCHIAKTERIDLLTNMEDA